jgi:hypothetical protein
MHAPVEIGWQPDMLRQHAAENQVEPALETQLPGRDIPLHFAVDVGALASSVAERSRTVYSIDRARTNSVGSAGVAPPPTSQTLRTPGREASSSRSGQWPRG